MVEGLITLHPLPGTYQGKLPSVTIHSTEELFQLLEGEVIEQQLLDKAAQDTAGHVSQLQKDIQDTYGVIFISQATPDLIEQYFLEHPQLEPGKYLNNFVHLLPNGYSRELRLKYASTDDNYSMKYRDEGVEVFFAHMDRLLVELGYDIDKLPSSFPSHTAYNTHYFPLYLAMRKLGYHHFDLGGQML